MCTKYKSSACPVDHKKSKLMKSPIITLANEAIDDINKE